MKRTMMIIPLIITALHWGAKHGKKEMIRLVADRGADVNSRSQGGYTALHIAAIHSKESVMQFLIQDYHADINVRDFSGRKARHYLKEGASSYMQQMMTGKTVTSPPRIRLMALAENSPPGKRQHHSIMSSLLGGSFREIRNSFRIWGSADNLDHSDDNKRAPLSPKSKPKNMFSGFEYLMPPPAALPKSRTRSEITAPFGRSELRKSESDPNIMESSEAAYV
ncbi:protein fem-1 homolog C-like [Asterias rubens]|uniref:protein fem-1 homolog C-like n=1 Tax=Asterias rubens TaxID=7604 RepID=UPI0014553316|nr:protein fem-1 homolog C-like [Asterias rubens]